MSCYIDPLSCLSWDALLPYVHPYARGAPDEVMLQAIRSSAIEFCRRSGVLHDENTLDIQAYVKDYPLETLCDYEIVRTYEVVVSNTWRYRPSITKNRVCWTLGGYQFYMQQPDIVVITNPPSMDIPNGLQVEFIVQPKQDGCTVDNLLYESWAEGIAFGAIARLLMMPNTSWFSMPTAQAFQVKYRSELARARTSVDLNFTSGSAIMQTERWI